MIGFLKKHKEAIGAVIAVAALYAFLFAVGIGCPIKYLTGISCAGCGMSRALFHALTLDFKGAFLFHPLWPVPFVAVLLIIFRRKIKKQIYYPAWALIILMFLGVYIFRMLDVNDTIVVFEPSKGLLLRLIK